MEIYLYLTRNHRIPQYRSSKSNDTQACNYDTNPNNKFPLICFEKSIANGNGHKQLN